MPASLAALFACMQHAAGFPCCGVLRLPCRTLLMMKLLVLLQGSKLDSGPRANTHSFFHGAWLAAAAGRSGMPLSLQAVAARVDAGGCTSVRAVLGVHD